MREEKRNAPGDVQVPLVSVVIPTYNYAPYLRRCLESCLEQTCGSVEIIVVDDGSTDETEQVVRETGRGVRYISQRNMGVSSARNTGMDLARGEFIVFLDADDYLVKDGLKMRLDAFLTLPSIDFVITATYSQKGQSGILKNDVRATRDFLSGTMDRMLLRRHLPFATCAVLMRSKIAKQFAFPLHLSNGEDIAYFTKVFFRRKGVFLARPTAVTVSHPDSLRHRMDEIGRQGNGLVDTIFDDPYYEGALDALRRDFTAYRQLELFRRFCKSGEGQSAGRCLARAVALRPATLLKVDYLVRLLRLYIGRAVRQRASGVATR